MQVIIIQWCLPKVESKYICILTTSTVAFHLIACLRWGREQESGSFREKKKYVTVNLFVRVGRGAPPTSDTELKSRKPTFYVQQEPDNGQCLNSIAYSNLDGRMLRAAGKSKEKKQVKVNVQR